MRALLLLLVFFFLNFTPDDGPPPTEDTTPYSENLLNETQTLFVGEENRGRFLVKPKGNYQPMRFCDLIPGQTYKIFAVRGKTCEPKVSLPGEDPVMTFEFVAEDECMDFTYYAGMCQEANYISIGCKSCKKDDSFMQDFMLFLRTTHNYSSYKMVTMTNIISCTNFEGDFSHESVGEARR